MYTFAHTKWSERVSASKWEREREREKCQRGVPTTCWNWSWRWKTENLMSNTLYNITSAVFACFTVCLFESWSSAAAQVISGQECFFHSSGSQWSVGKTCVEDGEKPPCKTVILVSTSVHLSFFLFFLFFFFCHLQHPLLYLLTFFKCLFVFLSFSLSLHSAPFLFFHCLLVLFLFLLPLPLIWHWMRLYGAENNTDRSFPPLREKTVDPSFSPPPSSSSVSLCSYFAYLATASASLSLPTFLRLN